jgi:thioredoxin 2
MADATHVVCTHYAPASRVPVTKPTSAALCGDCRRHLSEGLPIDVDEADCEHHIRLTDIPVLLDV